MRLGGGGRRLGRAPAAPLRAGVTARALDSEPHFVRAAARADRLAVAPRPFVLQSESVGSSRFGGFQWKPSKTRRPWEDPRPPGSPHKCLLLPVPGGRRAAPERERELLPHTPRGAALVGPELPFPFLTSEVRGRRPGKGHAPATGQCPSRPQGDAVLRSGERKAAGSELLESQENGEGGRR